MHAITPARFPPGQARALVSERPARARGAIAVYPTAPPWRLGVRSAFMKILYYVSWPVRAWNIPDTAVEGVRHRDPDIEFVHARTPDDASLALPDVDAVL